MHFGRAAARRFGDAGRHLRPPDRRDRHPGRRRSGRALLCRSPRFARSISTDSGLSAKRRQSIDELGMGTNAKNHFQLDTPARAKLDRVVRRHDDGRALPAVELGVDRGPGRGRTSVITIWRGGRVGCQLPDRHRRTSGRRRAIVDANLAAFERGVPGIDRRRTTGARGSTRGSTTPGSGAPTPASCPASTPQYWGYLKKAEDGVHFAGEHTSTHSQGYLNGGVESGDRAAREVLHALA